MRIRERARFRERRRVRIFGWVKKTWTRLKLALRQNRLALLFVVGWLIANTIAFVRVFGLSRRDAIEVALCKTLPTPADLGKDNIRSLGALLRSLAPLLSAAAAS